MKKSFWLLFIVLFCITEYRSQAPTATIVSPSSTLCTDRVYTYSSNVSGSAPFAYTWSLTPSAGFTVVSDFNSPQIKIRFGSSITYSLSLLVADANGTVSTGVLTSVFKSARASYNASLTSNGFPVDLVLTNYSSNALSYTWDFFGAVPSQTAANIVQTFTTAGNYTVALIAGGSNGCNDTLRYNFVIDEISGVELPNIFTPNNDGANDVFKPITKGIKEIKVHIYNRWGNLMHEWTSLNGFWDGYTTSGIMCPDGVYFYVVEATGFDGKTYKLKNHLTLIR